MKEWFEIEEEWNELIDIAKNECVFGEQLDNDLFKRCLNDALNSSDLVKKNRHHLIIQN